MKAVGILAVIMMVFVLCFGGGVLMYWGHVNNTDAQLRATATNKETLNEASLDTMWKILKDKYGVTDKYKNDFKDIYPDLIQKQNMDKNLLAKFVSQSLPKLSPALYKDLSNAVEAQRKSFYNNQKELLNIKNQHDILRTSVPAKWFLTNSSTLNVTIVTSDDASIKFKTGKDNDTLFNGDKK